mmetsp:Transcript_30852/g.73518  ORF Transcript_30852/g.73518 Transcript_30852/m.73518 type:complete len:103 (-) Transcript_30852:1004-1312(-)
MERRAERHGLVRVEVHSQLEAAEGVGDRLLDLRYAHGPTDHLDGVELVKGDVGELQRLLDWRRGTLQEVVADFLELGAGYVRLVVDVVRQGVDEHGDVRVGA